MAVTFFSDSSFLQVVSAVVLWPACVQKSLAAPSFLDFSFLQVIDVVLLRYACVQKALLQERLGFQPQEVLLQKRLDDNLQQVLIQVRPGVYLVGLERKGFKR